MNKHSVTRTGRPKMVAIITGLLGLLALLNFGAWAVSSPIGSSPDEDYHLVSIWCAQGEREDLCQKGTNYSEVSAPTALIVASNCFAFNPKKSADCELPASNEFTLTSRSNADGGYPPVFYATMSLFASTNFDASVITMRIFNSIIFLGLMVATILLSPQRLRAPILMGSLITIIPLGMFLIPSVNPSSWSITSATVLWGSIVGYLSTPFSARKWVLLGISFLAMFLGAGARSDSAVYSVLAIIIAALLSFKEIKKNFWQFIPILTFIPISLFFYLRSGQSGVISPDRNSDVPLLQAIFSNLSDLPSLWVGNLGTWGLGWLDTQMPPLVWSLTIFVFFGMVFLGLSKTSLNQKIALGVLVLAITAIPLYVLVKDNVSVGSGVQPRYIFPLLIMIAGVSLWTASEHKLTLSGIQVAIITAGLAIANSLSLHTNMRRYITGTDLGGFDLGNNAEWWWNSLPNPMLIWFIGTCSFTALLIILAFFQKANRLVS